MYKKFRNQFDRDEKIIVTIKTKDIFEKDFSNKLFKIHEEAKENVPHIKGGNSLKNTDYKYLLIDWSNYRYYGYSYNDNKPNAYRRTYETFYKESSRYLESFHIIFRLL